MAAVDDVLAAVPYGGWVTARAVADGHGWKRPYVREILAVLTADGFVQRRGGMMRYEYCRLTKRGTPRRPSRSAAKRKAPTPVWPQDDLDRLRALAAEGKYVDEIAPILGRTYFAVDSKLRAMGVAFTRRPKGCWVVLPEGATERQRVGV